MTCMTLKDFGNDLMLEHGEQLLMLMQPKALEVRFSKKVLAKASEVGVKKYCLYEAYPLDPKVEFVTLRHAISMSFYLNIRNFRSVKTMSDLKYLIIGNVPDITSNILEGITWSNLRLEVLDFLPGLQLTQAILICDSIVSLRRIGCIQLEDPMDMLSAANSSFSRIQHVSLSMQHFNITTLFTLAQMLKLNADVAQAYQMKSWKWYSIMKRHSEDFGKQTQIGRGKSVKADTNRFKRMKRCCRNKVHGIVDGETFKRNGCWLKSKKRNGVM
ncbi:hypothetical protein HDU76_012908 [Blyttiomyces sp. JEL0837]|nr:hypothetical protein HDU76_012908 [Blyttiomyces sp. JEL0837]